MIKKEIEGVFILKHEPIADRRGTFTKIYSTPPTPGLSGNAAPFIECYYSVSASGVVRGLHFQVPPHDHTKLVTCLEGSVFDCVMDLRKRSSTYGLAIHHQLVPGESIVVPSGCAHGFCSTSDNSLLLYHVTSAYSPLHDAGIHWTSARLPWPVPDPILSDRDRAFPQFGEFSSPF